MVVLLGSDLVRVPVQCGLERSAVVVRRSVVEVVMEDHRRHAGAARPPQESAHARDDDETSSHDQGVWHGSVRPATSAGRWPANDDSSVAVTVPCAAGPTERGPAAAYDRPAESGR